MRSFSDVRAKLTTLQLRDLSYYEAGILNPTLRRDTVITSIELDHKFD